MVKPKSKEKPLETNPFHAVAIKKGGITYSHCHAEKTEKIISLYRKRDEPPLCILSARVVYRDRANHKDGGRWFTTTDLAGQPIEMNRVMLDLLLD